MRAILTIAKSNIFRKKGISILITIIILLSSLIFSIALGILQMMNKPFEKMFTALNASHTILFYDKNLNQGKDIFGFWESHEDIKSISILSVHLMKGNAYFKGKKIDTNLIISEVPEKKGTQDMLQYVEGNRTTQPGKNEIWLPTAFAYSNQIKIGDKLELPTLSGTNDYTVTAIVVDPHYSSGMSSPLRVWVQTDEIKKKFNKDNTVAYLGIRYKEYSEKVQARAWKQFEKNLGQNFVGLIFKYELISFGYTFLYQIIGIILILFSLIIVAVGLAIISFTISSSIISDYSTIGVFKAQGFSSRNVSLVYILQFFLMSLLVIPLGTLLSLPITKLLLANMTKSLGMLESSSSVIFTGIVTFVILSLFVVATAYISSRKASKIKPSQAIRFGAPEKKHSRQRNHLSGFNTLPVMFMLSIKDLLSEKRQFLFLLFAGLITSLVISFSLTTIATLNNVFESGKLMGLDNSELSVVNSGKVADFKEENLVEILKEQKEIKSITPMRYLLKTSFYIKELDLSQNVIGKAYDGDLDTIGLVSMNGRNPVDSNEIAISYGLSNKLKKHAGDIVEINLEGKIQKLLITGIFQTINNSGDDFMVQLSNIQTSNLAMPLAYQVKLQNNINPDSYETILKEKLGKAAEITSMSKKIKKQFGTVLSSMQTLILIIVLVVSLMCFVIIFNMITINILQMKKKYGIYKFFGMSSLDIRKILIYMVQAATVLGSIVGVTLGVFVTSFMMSTIFGSMGIARMDIVLNWGGLLMILPVCMLITAISTWIPSGKVLKVNPRNLIVE